MSTAVSLSPKFQERRDFERVQDAVALELLLPGEPAGAAKVIRDKYSLAGYEAVRADYPEITAYISELEGRLRELAPAASDALELPTHKVSLSGSGMAFADERMLQPGDIVSMRITLFPSRVTIACTATVISCLLYTSPSPRDKRQSRMPSSA